MFLYITYNLVFVCNINLFHFKGYGIWYKEIGNKANPLYPNGTNIRKMNNEQ